MLARTRRQIGLIGIILILAIEAGCRTTNSNAVAKFTGVELKYLEPKYLTGAIYNREAQPRRLLFTFKRVATLSGSSLKVVRDYAYPDGKLAVREQVVYDGNNLVSYQQEELQIGAVGRIKIQHDSEHLGQNCVELEYTQKPASKKPSAAYREPFDDNTLINDMVAPFIIAHWAELLQGAKVKCRYLVVSRRESVGFVFSKASESKWQGRDVLIVKFAPSSPFIALLAKPLFFTIEAAPPHRVLQYSGRITPKLEAKGQWQDLDAVTVFDWK